MTVKTEIKYFNKKVGAGEAAGLSKLGLFTTLFKEFNWFKKGIFESTIDNIFAAAYDEGFNLQCSK